MHSASMRVPGTTAWTQSSPHQARGDRLAFSALLLVVIVEFSQVQTLFPILAAIRPALIANIVLIAAVWSHSTRMPWGHPVLVVMVAMIAFAALWVPFAANNFWAYRIFEFLVTELFFCLGALATITTRKRLATFMFVFLGCLVVQALWGLTHGGTGLGGFFADENDLALAMCVGIPFGVFCMASLRSPVAKVTGLAMAALFTATIGASLSRGGVVGLAATGLSMISFSRRRVAIAVGIVLGALFFWMASPSSYRAEMRSMFDGNESTRVQRLVMWENALRMFVANPILGVGPGNLPWNIERYEEADRQQRSHAGRAVHSIYFTVLPEWGLVGTALFLVLGWLVMRELFRLKRAGGSETAQAMARATLCAGVGWGAAGAFLSVLYYPYLFKFVAMTIAAGNIASLEAEALAEAGDEAVEVDARG